MSRSRGDRGDSLVEILVALAVLSIGMVALLSALTTNITITGTNRDQSQAGAVLVSAAEHVKSAPSIPFSCTGGSAVAISTTDVPRPAAFSVTYGPAEAVEGQPCTEVVAVPVRVTGEGFDRTVRVLRRAP